MSTIQKYLCNITQTCTLSSESPPSHANTHHSEECNHTLMCTINFQILNNLTTNSQYILQFIAYETLSCSLNSDTSSALLYANMNNNSATICTTDNGIMGTTQWCNTVIYCFPEYLFWIFFPGSHQPNSLRALLIKMIKY